MSRTLSARQARRIALAAQGLANPRPTAPVTRRTFRKLVGELGALQLDSVNVFARAHYVPPFARLGPYPTTLLEQEAWGKRPSLFEYWAHAACLIPIERQPLFRWKMRWRRDGGGSPGWKAFLADKRGYIDQVLAEIERRGPVTGGDFAPEGKRTPGWWNWHDGKTALEWLFNAGFITTKTRRGFERVYDLTERVLPRAVLDLPTPPEAEAKRALVRLASRALGVATVSDLAAHYGLKQRETAQAVNELIEEGELVPVTVEGWGRPAYLAKDARLPRRVWAASLLAPFDNLMWDRQRVETLFGMRYRIEIYVPAEKRVHGYYVYPFLLGEQIAARVDLKADRAAGVLRVQAAHREPGADEGQVASALAAELRTAADWLQLPDVAVAGRGDLAADLRRALG
ncbi:MAG TPA: crosslink repair DNA glycosylase YcaQ family protein [Caulobacteraceae bacterium]|nr:crosslink repair DNA glycosylase YcaQ family protein [Caulobacteraceae bacterium]